MSDQQRRVDAIRAHSTEVENHVIDVYRAGRISRREFARRAGVLGMSAGTIAFLAGACGSGEKGGNTSTTQQTDAKVKPGGTVRAGTLAPSGAVDPVKIADGGGLILAGQTAEYLIWSDAELNLQPRLAESWKPNGDSTVWTFKIRQGVKFHDGRAMDAQDVAATFNRLVDPANSSNALSAFEGVLSKGNAKATDAQTVEFRLDAPNGTFPYLVASDNYNGVILPKDYDGDFEKNFNGTGPFKLERYTQGQNATFVKNADYWDPKRKPNPDRTELRFYTKEQARVLALQSGEIDALQTFSVSGGRALLTDPNVQTIALKAGTHRQVHMRTDKPPFDDPRVRQAMALLVNRDALVRGLFKDKATTGNDTPFAPVYPYAGDAVAPRKPDVARAKQLLADAGVADGFSVTLSTWDGFEIPDLAQLLQNDVKQAGIDLKLEITDVGTYYGDAVYGKSPWLDSTMGITDYAHRGSVNVFLRAPLESKGPWNAAHYRNKDYDRAVREFIAQSDVDAQTKAARRIQEILVKDTPILVPYYYDYLVGVRKGFGGIEGTASGHLQFTGAGAV